MTLDQFWSILEKVHRDSGSDIARRFKLLEITLGKLSLAEVQSAIGDNLQKIERLYVPQKTKKTEHIEGSPAEIAKKLVDKLRNELRVL